MKLLTVWLLLLSGAALASPDAGDRAAMVSGLNDRYSCLWPDGRLLWASSDSADCSLFAGYDVTYPLYRSDRRADPIVVF